MSSNLDATRGLPVLFAGVLAFLIAGATPAAAQTPSRSGAPAGPDETLLQWPLPPGAAAYGAIDGRRMYGYVVEQAEIARRYRDQGNRLWGRIIGTPSDVASADWLMEKFRRLGLSDVKSVPYDLEPQWLPESWEMTVTGGGQTLRLESAWPAQQSPGTPAAGLDVEAVWVGTGSANEFAARDVRGKAVFIYSMPLPRIAGTAAAEGALERATAGGAAVIVLVAALPGNFQNQLHTRPQAIPTFALGQEDGYAVRDLIAAAPAGRAPRVRVSLDAPMVPGLKTATVWGVLPGRTDETIFVVAHRDGYFDAGTDNASGVATMIELAEFYAKQPAAQRRRTMIFVGLSGHHPPPQNPSVEWLLAENVFEKSALVINSEHTSTVLTYFDGSAINTANTYTAQLWWAGGGRRPKLQDIAVRAFEEFGVSTYSTPEFPAPPGSDLSMLDFWRFVPGVTTGDFNMYFHTDQEIPETVPWTGMEATTRAFARIIDDVNELDLAELRRPRDPVETSIARGALPGSSPEGPELYWLDDHLLHWPVLPGNEAFATIDGRRLHGHVVELAEIAQRNRDQGNARFWGRIPGTSADEQTGVWLMDKLREAGLSDVRKVAHELPPQWRPRSWTVSVGGARPVNLASAQPAYLTSGTPAGGMDLEAVWVGSGSEADYAGRDVAGKAVFIFSQPQSGRNRSALSEGALRRADQNGAAAIFEVIAHPGNFRYQMEATGTRAPTFALGWQDGYVVRDLLDRAGSGPAPRVKIQLEVEMAAALTTGTIAATLPGRTDETIYVVAHTGGWFDGATNNASGVATMLGLAEHFAKIPAAQRQRRIVFLGLSGHPDSDNPSVAWARSTLEAGAAKTALVIDADHTSALQTYLRGATIRRANTFTAQSWYAGGTARPRLQEIATRAFRDFGVARAAELEQAIPTSDALLRDLDRRLPVITSRDFDTFVNTDAETAEMVPWTGLEATTRAFAKIIAEVDELGLGDLDRGGTTP